MTGTVTIQRIRRPIRPRTTAFTDTVSHGHVDRSRSYRRHARHGRHVSTDVVLASTAPSDHDFSDYGGGYESHPEPGGSESDTSSDSDSGHDHEHLVASGTPDTWTASFDDTDQDNFNDHDDGSESSSQTTTGATAETDTNHDGFHATDGGAHSDVLHIGGSGDATTFTATAVSDRIEDTYTFTDSDDGNVRRGHDP